MNKFAMPMIVLLILLAAWVAVKMIGRDPSRPDADTALKVSVDTAGIGSLEISRGADTVRVQHAADGWRVMTAHGLKPADSEAVASALNNLNSIDTYDVISHNREKQAEFQVNDEMGTHVRVLGPTGSPMAELVIGKLGGFESQQMAMAQGRINEAQFFTYIRRAGTDDVYRVQGFFGGMLGTDTEQWRNHDVMNFHPLQLRSVKVSSPDSTLRLQLGQDAKWIMLDPPMPDSMEVDSTAIFRLASSLGSFRASGFIDTTVAETGFDRPALTIDVELVDGTSYKVAVGAEIPESQNLYYCRREGSDQLYSIAEYRLDQVKLPPEELLAKKADSENN